MAIDTEREYNPVLDHPLYTKIVPDDQNEYELWEEYEIRVPDEERGDDGPYNYVFDAILVGIEKAKWGEIPPLLKGYTTDTRDAQEAIEKIHPFGADGSFEDDDELVVLIFLRIDQTKEFITTDNDVLLIQGADTDVN